MNSWILLLLAGASLFVGLSHGVKVAKPATCAGRLTGHLTFDEEPSLVRTKRQGRRPRPRPGNPRRTPAPAPPPVTVPATTAAVTTPAATTGAATTGAATTGAATTGAATTVAATTGAATAAPDTSCEAQIYRTADGTCNNLIDSSKGSADQPFIRLLQPEYNVLAVNNENVYTPRRYSDVTQAELPNVRLISRFVHDPDNRPSGATIMAMQWGQFLDHDITATPVNPTVTTCCSNDLVLNDQEHADVNANGPCFPIIIPDNDPHFTTVESRCMENKRSYQKLVNGVPEQINLISAFVDGSQVYGSSLEAMTSLRSSEKGLGRLAEINDNLPEGSSSSCNIDEGREDEDYCLLAGDSRVNVYPGLAAMHTVFVRMHNIIADGLASGHVDWDDETVFQEARRINVALLQKISYAEYLRAIVGTAAMTQYRLESGTYDYEEGTDPTLANVFSTSAFRFGHSMIPDGLVINNLFYESIALFNNPRYALHSLDSLVTGLLTNVSQRVDRWYSTGMTNHMFETSAFNGLDIVSLNIQRGRDHGLPAYNKWRQHCDLTPFGTFDEMGPGGRRYSQVYGNIDDVDLYSGALEERPVDRGLVGETYACLIGKQFESLKFGDRFWYENPNSPTPFSEVQIREIERQTLGSVLCQTTNIASVQRNTFRTADPTTNPSTNCADVRTLDLSVF